MKSYLLLFSFAILCHACTKSSEPDPTPPAASIYALNCAAATTSSVATEGTLYNGTITVPYSGGNSVAYSTGAAITSTGVTGLTAILQGATLANGNGSFTYTVTGTPSSNGTAVFSISFAGFSCAANLTVNEAPLVQYGTPFASVTNRQDATLYQVNMRAFSTTSNFAGVTARLDSIKALGANVVYLMPIFPVGSVNSVNSPYCVKDYKAINSEFGTLTDLRALVDAAHSKNMSVILDWVANHTSWDNNWISSHSDWYLKNGAGAIISPPGMGWNDVAQLDFNSAAMRLEMIKSMKYWVYTANVDGFRFDYADGPPFDFWKQAVDTLRNISTHNLLLLAEGNRNSHFTAGFDFIFGFSFYGQLKNIFNNSQPATNIDALNNSEYVNATNGQQVVRYITNHDVNGSDGTPLSIFGGTQGSMAAFVVTAYMKAVPMIYNGQEVGMSTPLVFPFTGADINWTLNPNITAEYKKVIEFRNNSTAIRRGLLSSYSSADVCAFTKISGAEKVFVASNLRNSTITYTLPSAVANMTWTNAMSGANTALGAQVVLPPYSYLVLKN
jgi:glycosidase